MSNAVKFTPKNGRVHVRLERVNSHVEIVVSDTGAGIRPDFLPYVFERFRQADSGTTRKSGGLGLGLAIVRHIVEMHGGSVEASSAGEGEGATFRVRLPLMIVQPATVETRREHLRTERRDALTGLGDLHGVHVLAIDDEEDALTLLRVVLEAAGAQVTTLGSPLAALERIPLFEKLPPPYGLRVWRLGGLTNRNSPVARLQRRTHANGVTFAKRVDGPEPPATSLAG
jgi:hypothetical protein